MLKIGLINFVYVVQRYKYSKILLSNVPDLKNKIYNVKTNSSKYGCPSLAV